MRGRRWNEVDGRTPTQRPDPDREVDRALDALAENQHFRTFMNFYSELWAEKSVDRSAPDTGALLLIEGGRSLLRDIRTHVAKVVDARSGRKSDPE